MAEQRKYKLGELEFATEQEYNDAAGDLKKIKDIMAKYDVKDPGQAAKILSSIKAHPETFRSPYGKKFIVRLEKAAGATGAVTSKASASSAARLAGDKAVKKEKKKAQKKASKQRKKVKQASETGVREKPKLQIFSARNFAVGIVVILAVVLLSLLAPKLFEVKNKKTESGDIQRNMVTAYAKGQTELKAQLYTYYFDVMGKSETEARSDASKAITDNYVMDLSDTAVSGMSASQIEEVYDQLVNGGDIQNNSFVEPKEISALKERLVSAGLSGNTGNGMEGEIDEPAVINKMMDYQEQMYTSLSYLYGLLSYKEEDATAFAEEDMERMFGDVIYTFQMSDEEKSAYYQHFVEKGLIQGSQLKRFSTNPKEYALPDLTASIEISLHGGQAKSYKCSMLGYAPAASVFYELHAGDKKGYLCMRNNGRDTNYIQLADGSTVTCQGGFYLFSDDGLVVGEWFYNGNDIGILINGEQDNLIRCVSDLVY